MQPSTNSFNYTGKNATFLIAYTKWFFFLTKVSKLLVLMRSQEVSSWTVGLFDPIFTWTQHTQKHTHMQTLPMQQNAQQNWSAHTNNDAYHAHECHYAHPQSFSSLTIYLGMLMF